MSTLTLPARQTRSLLRAIWSRIPKFTRPEPPIFLSDRIARDVGLEPGQGPIGKIEFPSQVWSHPRM